MENDATINATENLYKRILFFRLEILPLIKNADMFFALLGLCHKIFVECGGSKTKSDDKCEAISNIICSAVAWSEDVALDCRVYILSEISQQPLIGCVPRSLAYLLLNLADFEHPSSGRLLRASHQIMKIDDEEEKQA